MRTPALTKRLAAGFAVQHRKDLNHRAGSSTVQPHAFAAVRDQDVLVAKVQVQGVFFC